MKKTHYHWIFNSSELFGPKKVSSKFRNYYIEMSPVKFSTTFFRPFTSNSYNFQWTLQRDEKMTKSQQTIF